MRLYWVLFPIEGLRLAVETAKRILAKEKIDRQLAGQSSSTPFMNIGDGYTSKKVVTFDIQDRLDDKTDKLTSMKSNLTAQGSNQNKLFKPKIYQGKMRGQTRNYCVFKVIIRIDSNQIMDIVECHLEVELSMDKVIEEGGNMLTIIETILGKEILVEHKMVRGKNFRGRYRGNYRNENFGRGRSRSRERQYSSSLDGMMETVVVDEDQV